MRHPKIKVKIIPGDEKGRKAENKVARLYEQKYQEVSKTHKKLLKDKRGLSEDLVKDSPGRPDLLAISTDGRSKKSNPIIDRSRFIEVKSPRDGLRLSQLKWAKKHKKQVDVVYLDPDMKEKREKLKELQELSRKISEKEARELSIEDFNKRDKLLEKMLKTEMVIEIGDQIKELDNIRAKLSAIERKASSALDVVDKVKEGKEIMKAAD